MDTSDSTIGFSLHQRIIDAWQQLAFYSCNLIPTQQYTIRTIINFLRSTRPSVTSSMWLIFHNFYITQDTYLAFRCSPQLSRFLDSIGQFSTAIRHLSGQEYIVPDALSRANFVAVAIDYRTLRADSHIPCRSHAVSMPFPCCSLAVLKTDSHIPCHSLAIHTGHCI
jgi:hypothetical protein